MKGKLLICLLAVTLIAGLGWGCAGEPKEQTYKVGTITCVTGAIPQMGEYCLRGWELAKEDIDKSGMVAPSNIELCVEDGQNVPKLALASLTRLIDVEKVPYIETVGSSVVLACAPICEESQVVLMNTAAKSPLITDAGDYIFSITVNAVAEGNAGVDFIKNTLNVDKCSVLYVNNEYGLTVGEYFIDLYQKEGGTILDSIVYELGATDYRTHITKLKAKNPPVIYLVGNQNEAGYIAKQTVELGLNTQWVAPCGVITPEMFAIGAET